MESSEQAVRRLDHGVSNAQPVALKWDRWERVGPGQCDMHFEVELGIVCSGAMRRSVGRWSSVFRAGDLWLNGMWEVHAAEVLEAPLELVMLHCHPPFLACLDVPERPARDWLSFFTAPPARRPHPASGERTRWLMHAERLRGLDGVPAWSAAVRARLVLCEILTDLARTWSEFPGRSPRRFPYDAIGSAIDLVFREQRHVAVGEAASVAGMNINTFRRRFRDLMGMGFGEFALRQRLRSAALALRATDRPLKAIAADWGFTDGSHFHRHFTRVYGVTPRQYRLGLLKPALAKSRLPADG